MGFYDFQCSSCGEKEINVRVGMNDMTKDCPKCGEVSKRLLALPSRPLGGDTPSNHSGGRRE